MKKEHFEVLLEDIQAKFEAVLEYVVMIPKIQQDVKNIDSRLQRVEIRLDVVSDVVVSHSKQLQEIANWQKHHHQSHLLANS